MSGLDSPLMDEQQSASDFDDLLSLPYTIRLGEHPSFLFQSVTDIDDHASTYGNDTALSVMDLVDPVEPSRIIMPTTLSDTPTLPIAVPTLPTAVSPMCDLCSVGHMALQRVGKIVNRTIHDPSTSEPFKKDLVSSTYRLRNAVNSVFNRHFLYHKDLPHSQTHAEDYTTSRRDPTDRHAFRELGSCVVGNEGVLQCLKGERTHHLSSLSGEYQDQSVIQNKLDRIGQLNDDVETVAEVWGMMSMWPRVLGFEPPGTVSAISGRSAPGQSS